MAQIKIDKDRSYRLGKGNALDAYNDALAEDFHDDALPKMKQLRPTKGFLKTSRARLENPGAMEATFRGWARLAAKITGSSVGGEPRYGIGTRLARKPPTRAREMERRQRQMAARS
jgi:hypothetical protein